MLTTSGKAYGFGCNKYGQIAQPKSTRLVGEPTLLKVESVRRIFSGFNQSFFITEGGRVSACGDASKGRLGLLRSEPQYAVV